MNENLIRRRFQFSLRTLLIGVTLLSLPCAYIGWQAKIVRERRAMVASLSDEPFAMVVLWSDDFGISAIRRWLGDHAYCIIELPERDDEMGNRYMKAFPEASVVVPFARNNQSPAVVFQK